MFSLHLRNTFTFYNATQVLRIIENVTRHEQVNLLQIYLERYF